MRKLFTVLMAVVVMVSFNGQSMVLAAADSPVSTNLQKLVITDIENHWGKPAIDKVIEDGIMVALENGSELKFEPNARVDRALAATVLNKAFQLDFGDKVFIKQPELKDYYNDVAADAPEGVAILNCAVNEIFDCQEKLFEPKKNLTRLELAQAYQRAFNSQGYNIPMIMSMPVFSDYNELSTEQINAIVFVNNTGIMKGYDNRFRPGDIVTRAELAQTVVNAMPLIKMNNNDSQAVSITSLDKAEKIERLDVELRIPVLHNLKNLEVQEKINNTWESDAQAIVNEIKESLQEDIDYEDYPDRPPYAIATDYALGTVNSDFVSLYVDYYQYTGGAHGITERRAYNYDLNQGSSISLGMLFKDGYDYTSKINAIISEQIKIEPDLYFQDDMGFQGISADQDFYIKGDKLIVYFQQYEIAPYVAGIPEFEIALSDLSEGLGSLKLN